MKPENIKTMQDVKDYTAETLANFDTVEVIDQQVVKILEDIQGCNCPDWVKTMAYDAMHLMWAGMEIKDNALKKVRAVVEDESEGNYDSK